MNQDQSASRSDKVNNLPARILRIKASAFGFRRSMHLWQSVPAMREARNEEYYLGRYPYSDTIAFKPVPKPIPNFYELRI